MRSSAFRHVLDAVVRAALAVLMTALLSACAAHRTTAYSNSRDTYLVHAPGAVVIQCKCAERPRVDLDVLNRALCVRTPPPEVAPDRQPFVLRGTEPGTYSTRRQYCEALNAVPGSRGCVQPATAVDRRSHAKDNPDRVGEDACTLDLPAAQLQLDALMCEAVCTAKSSPIRNAAG